MTQTLMDIMARATDDDIAIGEAWYAEAHALARSLSPNYRQAAGVIAAMSPQTSWAINKTIAIRAYETGIVTGGLGDGRRKATAIMAGAEPLDILGGNKVRSFFDNICNPYGDAVTIDRHAYSAAIGEYATAAESGKVLARKGEYNRFADMYRAAADSLGMVAPTLQAIVWVLWRRERGIVWAG